MYNVQKKFLSPVICIFDLPTYKTNNTFLQGIEFLRPEVTPKN